MEKTVSESDGVFLSTNEQGKAQVLLRQGVDGPLVVDIWKVVSVPEEVPNR
jgi:hypothetical protein